MEDAKNHIKCAHCEGAGTCRNGDGGASCLVCKKAHKLKTGESASGLICSVCDGKGMVSAPIQMSDRVRDTVAGCILLIVYILVWAFMDNAHFPEVLAFSATLAGSVTGYYFGSRAKSNT
jgi:hypothetical protein